jgi:8-oxo-dGTP pyrophosphatase MutT (NUDIX family)
MTFATFQALVPLLQQHPLPALSAHEKVVPEERRRALHVGGIPENARQAAVLIYLYPIEDVMHAVFIRRNDYPGVHSGQIAFPGGKVESEDASLWYTALREAHEEVGILPENVTLIKPITSVYIPPSNFQVFPFLAYGHQRPNFVLQIEEVSEILEFPLAHLFEDANLTSMRLTTSYSKSIEVPAFQIENQIIWGATAMMVSELKDSFKALLSV